MVSAGLGAAATAYEKTKERTYSDLDFAKHEFLPFIVGTTGTMGKAAYGFCKELKRRRDSLKCDTDINEEKKITVMDLLVAISIELQRANSRMVLERTPHSGNLIASGIKKYTQSIAIKRIRLLKIFV